MTETPIGEDDLHGFVDGRLAPERHAAVARYLDDNPDIAGTVATDAALRAELRARLERKLHDPVPARLRVAAIVARRHVARRRRWRAAAAAMAWLALGAGGGWAVRGWLGTPRMSGAEALLESGALAAHRTFVVETAHPVEVAAAQETHLVQWLSRRLGHALRAPDLAPQGYRLMGGRLLPAGQGNAAQFMYEDGKGARVTLYVDTDAPRGTEFRFAQQGDVAAFAWSCDGLGYVIAAAADRQHVLDLAEAVYRQLEPGTPVPRVAL